MVSLLIDTPAAGDGATDTTRFGGKPSAPPGPFAWPVCRSCEGHMQFLGQLRVPREAESDSLLLLFMCQNDPGLCDEWEADGGGNRVIAVDCGPLALVEPPATGAVSRSVLHGARIDAMEGDDYDEARDAWTDASGTGGREILGQLGGEPAWLQGEEVPACDACAAPMSFVAQLEEGPAYDTAMNFGGGCAYVYRCRCDRHQAKMLWQC